LRRKNKNGIIDIQRKKRNSPVHHQFCPPQTLFIISIRVIAVNLSLIPHRLVLRRLAGHGHVAPVPQAFLCFTENHI
jgi:hypothetical protein